MQKKRLLGLMLTLAVLITACLFSRAAGDSGKLFWALGVLISSVILWTCGTFPMSVTTLFMISLLALSGILSFHDAMAQISTSTSLFILGSSALTAAVRDSALLGWITDALLRRFLHKEKRLLFLLGITVTVSSAFMSSLATCAIYAALLAEFLQRTGLPDRSRLQRDVMLMIPACAGIGGFMSPVGTPANILLMDYLSGQGIQITFAQWCLIGFPTGLTASVIFLAFLMLLSPPEKIQGTPVSVRPVLARRDHKLLWVLCAEIIGWMLSSWIPGIDVTMIALLGMVLMFLPGMDLLQWKRFTAQTDWDLVIMMGSVSVLMYGIASTGLLAEIASGFTGLLSGLSGFAFFAVLSVLLFLLRTCIPTTTAVVALLGPLLIQISDSMSIPAAVPLMLLGFWTASALIIVYTEPIYLITYQDGKNYQAADLLRIGIPASFALAVLLALLLPWLVPLVLA